MQANTSFRSRLVQDTQDCSGLLLGNSPTSSLPLSYPSLTSVQSQPAFHPPNLYYLCISPLWLLSVLWAMCLLYSSKFLLLSLSTQGYPIPSHPSFLLATSADRHKGSSLGCCLHCFSLRCCVSHVYKRLLPFPSNLSTLSFFFKQGCR